MRIRVDGIESLLLRESRLALRVAGFIVVEDRQPADYVVGLVEHEHGEQDIVVRGSDGPFERLAINMLAAERTSLRLERASQPNDRLLEIAIPPDDGLRRATASALVKIFLSYVSHPTRTKETPSRPGPTPPIAEAQSQTLAPIPSTGPDPTIDLLTTRLVDLSRAYVEGTDRIQHKMGVAFSTLEDLHIGQAELRAHVDSAVTRIENSLITSVVHLRQDLRLCTRPWWQRLAAWWRRVE